MVGGADDTVITAYLALLVLAAVLFGLQWATDAVAGYWIVVR